MKKLAMVLSLVALMAFAVNAQTPDKGMIEFSMGGVLFQSQSEAKVTTINPVFEGGYFITPEIEVGGGLAVHKWGGDGATGADKFSGQILLNGKYHFMAKDKMWPYAGLHFGMGFGDGILGKAGGTKAPMNVGGAVGVKYWPLEGGALYGELMVNNTMPKELKEMTIGLNLGILIRLK